jgi:type VI secretion system protein ImpC
VQITYDLEAGGATEKRELPLVVGVLADLCIQQKPDFPRLKDRKFVEIDRDNFNDVLKQLNPSLTLRVPNRIQQGGEDLEVELGFKGIEDFEPFSVLKQVKPLEGLLEARKNLVNLIAKLDGNDALNAAIKRLNERLRELIAGKEEERTQFKTRLVAELDAQMTALRAQEKEPSVEGGATPPAASAAPAGEETTPAGEGTTPAAGGTAAPGPTRVDPSKAREPQEFARALIDAKLTRTALQNEGARNMLNAFVEQFLEQAEKFALEKAQHDTLERQQHTREAEEQWRLRQEETRKKLENDMVTMLHHRIALIDLHMSNQLNAILHAEDFRKLESTWRGLHYLVMRSETGSHLKIRVLNASQKELLKDLDLATDFDQSVLFKKVYEEEYGTFGGHPFSVLLGDYYFGRHPEHIKLLKMISNVAAAAHAPFISSAHPSLFDMESFTQLDGPRDLAKLFESSDMLEWRSFREAEDSRYVTLTLPRFLLRLPYGRDTVPVQGFDYDEQVDGNRAEQHEHYVWGNAAYALGARITQAFALHRWCAAIRGVENGGRVNDLPVHTFKTDAGDRMAKIPTEVAITDRREKELNDLGFMSLCYRKADTYAVFFGSQTVQKSRLYDTPQANANAQISAQLPYVLAASRFAHYLKVMMRDKIGSFTTREAVSIYLNRWISDYVQLNDEAAPDVKARQPLREARIDVMEVPGRPGAYRAIAFLRPHFQLNELSASIRLVAELPAPAAS